MIGAVIADRLLGKYRTILWLSLVYASGNLALALGAHSTWGVWTGLGLIALGSGGIKPCVSAHVGDQFGRGNWFRLRTIYQAFYFIINFGSFFAYLLIPWIGTRGRPRGVRHPGVLMVMSAIVFWMGRNVFIHVPPKPGGKLGLLDAASSIAFFMAAGHLFFTVGRSWPVLLVLSGGCIVVGALLFAWRQSIARDDGFLAITLTALWTWLRRPAVRVLDGGARALRRRRRRRADRRVSHRQRVRHGQRVLGAVRPEGVVVGAAGREHEFDAVGLQAAAVADPIGEPRAGDDAYPVHAAAAISDRRSASASR